MNATASRKTDVDLELANLVALEECYDTTPILAITPLLERPDEEELHTQFEEALYERATAFRSRLKSLRDSAPLRHRTQRVLIYSCSALSLILLGFDLMGLLVLHMR
jgi:hypothetical protein